MLCKQYVVPSSYFMYLIGSNSAVFLLLCLLDATTYPQITIEQDLPRQNKGNQNRATLWLWGASHSITLDGTADRGYPFVP